MEAVIFIGVQGSGKSSFYLARFYRTHVRINLDMLRTRHREQLLLSACVEGKARFVVDNTNPTVAERARYIAPARAVGFKVIGYYFRASLTDALRRNSLRQENERVPEKGIIGTYRRLQLPGLAEGFDALYTVAVDELTGGFTVEEWQG
jgi:predicted kinase